MCALGGRMTDEQKRHALAMNLIKNIKPDTDSKTAKMVALAAQEILAGKIELPKAE